MSEFKLKRQNPLSVVALERLYLKADHVTICHDGDPDAAVLLAAAGSEIPIKIAIRLGLVDDPKKPNPIPADTKPTVPEVNRSIDPATVRKK